MKRRIVFRSIGGLLVLILFLCLFCYRKKEEKLALVSSFYNDFSVIIDSGHGGEDGGAIGISGVIEKDVNLKISQKLELLFNLFGVNTEMTRREDVSLCTDKGASLRQRKNSDLKQRAKKVEGTPNAILISVHQNSFPEDKNCHGAQVFFSANNIESPELAKKIQKVLTEKIDPTNKRTEKESPASVFLMKKAKCPAVLIECGFLSNEKETAMLVTDSYQIKLAAGIFSGYLKYKK